LFNRISDDEIFIKSQIDSIFLNIDVDNSGAISVNEFVTAASNKKELL
jgi:Ca2+-binding EF-hand superfamily protein